MEGDIVAPGKSGIPARWTSSAKSGIGTSASSTSRVWFTLSHGILNEIYFPRVDRASTRDLGLLVTDGHDFFSEEKRHTRNQVKYLAKGVPAYHLENTCNQGRYRIEKDIFTDPLGDTVLQRIRFIPLIGSLKDYHLYALLAPHLGNYGAGNTAWIPVNDDGQMLFAERDDIALALACSVPWINRSVGYVGVSDGWQDLMRHKQMTWQYTRADDGNVALMGEVDLLGSEGTFLLALGFGRTVTEARYQARASLDRDIDSTLARYTKEWDDWQNTLRDLPATGTVETNSFDYYRISTAVLRTHESKTFPGGIIASLSIPWGFAKGDNDLGGYHLVWPRDLVEVGGALLAAGANEDAIRVLYYLKSTQLSDGHWSQNMWLDGSAYWNGVQMDETAFPILLFDLVSRTNILSEEILHSFWQMVRNAARYLVLNGPVTGEDRWEEDAGYSPFTLAVEISALLAAADLADSCNESRVAAFLRETADAWESNIDRWTYVTGTDLAREVGVEGYYVRIAPPETSDAATPAGGFVPIKNRPPAHALEPATHIVSPDALALVRFGLRAADDPRIVNTVKVINAVLKVDTPSGVTWHRYNDDGYGEHTDGSPFDGTGIGRAWPLLTGERAHYELAAGRVEAAHQLLSTLQSFASPGGLLPEQVWDVPDLPERELFFGKPSGSAMPLVWAHAEYIKLLRSLNDGRVYDTPRQPFTRYVLKRTKASYSLWQSNQKVTHISQGKTLRIQTSAPAVVHWSVDAWQTTFDTATVDPGIGIHIADLPTATMSAATHLLFTIYWKNEQRWEGANYAIRIGQ